VLAIYASAALILAASLLLGRAILALVRWPSPAWLSGATGFATLVTASPFLVRLPGRATTAAVILLLVLVAAAAIVLWPWWARRQGLATPDRDDPAGPGREAPMSQTGDSRGEDERETAIAEKPDLRAGSRRRSTSPAPNAPEEPTSRAGSRRRSAPPAPGLAAEPSTVTWATGIAVIAIVFALATLPFVLNDRIGILGMGIYTNDHAAQLYWADWLQHGLGPEPNGVRFGYPIGPQSVAVIAAQVDGESLVSAFNGLLFAIPALTGLTALGALVGFPPLRRIAIAAICGLPYLAASFLAQSAFKEIAMGMFVLAFAIALASASAGRRTAAGPEVSPPAPWGGVLTIGVLLAAASVFTFSIPGLVWFAIALPIWLLATALVGESPIDWRRMWDSIARHRVVTAIIALTLIAVAVIAIEPATNFISKIDDVQASAGRLSSPVFGGEALGIWPEGDFRIVRTEVSGALLASAVGAAAVAYGALWLLLRRRFALLSMLAAGVIVYLGSRVFAEIHVQAKALAVIAPLALLIGLRGLLAPPQPTAVDEARGLGDEPRAAERHGSRWRLATVARYAFGTLVLLAALGSTFLALRAAPVSFDNRSAGLEQLRERIEGESVVFLGVDRFSAYDLRGTLIRAPAGYVPPEIAARDDKPWLQGEAADFDTLESRKLDQFDYAITTTAAYASTPPPNFEPVVRAGDYLLWRRIGETPRSRVLAEDGAPGAILDCAGDDANIASRTGTAVVLDVPAVAPYNAWSTPPPATPAAADQERGFNAPGRATTDLDLPAAGRYRLSLQYHSQVALRVESDGETLANLPPSLDGMYLSGAGRGAFWPAGELESERGGAREITVEAEAPTGLQDTLGVQRRVWLGDLAATPDTGATQVPIAQACGRYVDHFRLERRGTRG
jgi:hypothetical protein